MHGHCASVVVVIASSVGAGQDPTPPGPAPVLQGVIVFASDSDGDFDVYRVNADGSALTPLTENASRDTVPSWSPDGTKIAFASDRDGALNLFIMDADGKNPVRISDMDLGDSTRITWSPDGQRLAFDAREGNTLSIWACGVDGSNRKKIAANAMFPSWSPDGTKIAFNRGQLPQLWLMDTDGSNPATLMKQKGSMLPDLAPIWSADGTRLLYTAVTGTASDDAGTHRMTYEIRSVSAKGDDVQSVAGVRGMAVDWSADGSRILVTNLNDDGSDLQIITMGQNEPVPLSAGKGSEVSADWSCERPRTK